MAVQVQGVLKIDQCYNGQKPQKTVKREIWTTWKIFQIIDYIV